MSTSQQLTTLLIELGERYHSLTQTALLFWGHRLAPEGAGFYTGMTEGGLPIYLHEHHEGEWKYIPQGTHVRQQLYTHETVRGTCIEQDGRVFWIEVKDIIQPPKITASVLEDFLGFAQISYGTGFFNFNKPK